METVGGAGGGAGSTDFRWAEWDALPSANREMLGGPEWLPALLLYPEGDAEAVEASLRSPGRSSRTAGLTSRRVWLARGLTERAVTALLRHEGLPIPLGYGIPINDGLASRIDRNWSPAVEGGPGAEKAKQLRAQLVGVSKRLQGLSPEAMDRLALALGEVRGGGGADVQHLREELQEFAKAFAMAVDGTYSVRPGPRISPKHRLLSNLARIWQWLHRTPPARANVPEAYEFGPDAAPSGPFLRFVMTSLDPLPLPESYVRPRDVAAYLNA
jgi:hypothetical protein